MQTPKCPFRSSLSNQPKINSLPLIKSSNSNSPKKDNTHASLFKMSTQNNIKPMQLEKDSLSFLPTLNIPISNQPKENLKFDKFTVNGPRKPSISLNKDPITPSSPKKHSFFYQSPQMSTPKNLYKKNNILNVHKNSPKPQKSLQEFFLDESFPHIVMEFEQKVRKSSQLSRYFEKSDIKKMFKDKMLFFKQRISENLDWDISSQRYLESIHHKMNITNEDFNVFKGFFYIIMKEHFVEEDLIASFLNLLEAYRKSIVFEITTFQKAFSGKEDFERLFLDKFYENVKNNHIISQIFVKKDLKFQIKHCSLVFNYLIREESTDFKGEMQKVHRDCGINDDVFYHFKQCFLQSLRFFQKKKCFFTEDDFWEIADQLENLRQAITSQETYYDYFQKNKSFDKLIDVFIEKITLKPILEEIFIGFKRESLEKHAKIMLEFLLGGPTKYNKADITPIHYNLSISLPQFEAVRESLKEALTIMAVQEKDSNYILSELDYFQYNLCNMKPLLKRLGGEKTIDHLVSTFYLKAFQHSHLTNFFKNSDIVEMLNNQKNWFCKFFDLSGMKTYHFKDLRTFHLGMGITEEAFEFFVKTFLEELNELKLNDPNILKEAGNWLSRCKNDVLNKD